MTSRGRELVVMTHADAQVRSDAKQLTAAAKTDAGALDALLRTSGAKIEPLFGVGQEELAAVAGTRHPETNIEVPDLSVFHRVHAPDGDLERLAAKLLEHDAVEAAYVKPAAGLPVAPSAPAAPAGPAPPMVTPDFTSRQGYLDEPPGGIDARFAWTRPGGGGAKVNIIDIEQAWRFDHEDLGQNQGGVVGGTMNKELLWRNHGTAVLGELGGDRNAIGVTGICPEANLRAIVGGGSGAAVVAATKLLGRGDIILIEAHMPGPRHDFAEREDQLGYIPVEWWDDKWAAIAYATAHGVIVVEPAGNGAENLDDDLYNTPAKGFSPGWRNPFNRANRDSGAIVVGAGAPPSGNAGPDRSRLDFSNYGAMVDAQGWGAEVTTAGYSFLQGGEDENRWYTDRFGGTSSASPIVVGALACVQGTRSAQFNVDRLNPAGARALLRGTGSPQQDAPDRPATQRIGNRPSLGQMLPGHAIYGVLPRELTLDGNFVGGRLKWYRHLGHDDGTPAWSPGPKTVGDHWKFRHVFSGGDGVIYAITDSGRLLWYRHDGSGDGSYKWATPNGKTREIGHGWDFEHVFSAGAGLIYGVKKTKVDPVTGKRSGGQLVWYQHLGWSDGADRWSPKSGTTVGAGWDFAHVFGAHRDGVVYAITHDGDLLWNYHNGRGVGTFDWELPKGRKVGHGWDFKQVFYGGENVIYAITEAGDLKWYRHDGHSDGTYRWTTAPKRVGNGWNFEHVFAS